MCSCKALITPSVTRLWKPRMALKMLLLSLSSLLFVNIAVVDGIRRNDLETVQDYTDNAGRTFVFAIPENVAVRHDVTVIVSSTSSSQDAAHVEFFFKSLNIANATVPAGGSCHVTLPRRVVLEHDAIGTHYQDGILMTSDQDVTLQVFNDAHHRSMDGFLALPTHALGTEYFIMAYTPWIQSQFVIVGVEEGTYVRFLSSTPYQYGGVTVKPGVPLTILLDRLQAKQMACIGCDFTGSTIVSNKPVAVISGNRCAFVPHGDDVRSCDTMVEQLPPVNQWGSTYAIVPLIGRNPTITNQYRVLAARYGTEVSVGAHRVSLAPGHYHEFGLRNNESTLVIANEPVLLAQFISGFDADNSTANSTGRGDPTMTIVPDFTQGVTDATVATYDVTKEGTPMVNYLTVVAECREFANIRYDNEAIAATDASITPPQPIDLSDVCFVSRQMENGTHHVVSSRLNLTKFAAVQYGFADYNAYAHPAALSVRTTLCVTYASTGERIEHQCDQEVFVVELPYGGTYPPPAAEPCDYSECFHPITVIGIAAASAILAVIVETVFRLKIMTNYNTDHLSQEEARNKQIQSRVDGDVYVLGKKKRKSTVMTPPPISQDGTHVRLPSGPTKASFIDNGPHYQEKVPSYPTTTGYSMRNMDLGPRGIAHPDQL